MESFSGRQSLKFLAEEMNHQTAVVKQMFKVEKEYKYSLAKMPIGIDENDDIVNLNMNKSKVILVVGGRDAGKTWFKRMFWNRFYLAGGVVAIMTDIKPEYYTSTKPLQKQFHRFLLPGEKPQGFPVQSFYPLFLQKVTNTTYPNTQVVQVSLDELNLFDFYTLLGATDISDSRRLGIERSFLKVQDGTITNLEDLKKDIDKNTDIRPQSRNLLIAEVNNLERMGVIGDSFSDIDFSDVILEGRVPCLSLPGYEMASRYSDYAAAIAAIMMRKLYMAKKGGKISRLLHLLEVFDEINRFVPNIGTTALKEETLQEVDLSRQHKGSMIVSTQDYKRIPLTILEQASLIFFPYNISPNSAKEILREKASYEETNPITFGTEVRQLVGSMIKHKDGSRDWLLIDSERKENFVFRPLAPLSHHRQEGE